MTSDGRTQTRPGVDRPITRADLEAKLGQIRDATDSGASSMRDAGRTIGLGVAVAVVLLVFFLGYRRGKKRRTVVEIRRV
jgi:hypothetical protein